MSDFEVGVDFTGNQIDQLRQRVAELELALENEQAKGIHSCHADCSLDGCVNRRLRERVAELEAENARLHTRIAVVEGAYEIRDDQLRQRVAELEVENASFASVISDIFEAIPPYKEDGTCTLPDAVVDRVVTLMRDTGHKFKDEEIL